MKIGILYIGIGRYACFWPEFHESCEALLIPEAEKHYYVFTDKDEIKAGERVDVFHQDDMGWPLNSLMRFKMFRRISNCLQGQDYLFFFNSNAKIVERVTADDLLPGNEESYSALCIEDNPEKMSFEPRPESAAYVDRQRARFYFSGALNGGRCNAYLRLIEQCDSIVDTDLANGLMPLWHDESVLNRFLADKRVKVMRRNMGKPENWSEPQHAKIILRRKENVLGRGWLRNYKGREHTNTWLRKLLRALGLVK